MPTKKKTPVKSSVPTGPGGVPLVRQEPEHTLANAVQVWFGPPKIGKSSTFAALGTVAEEQGIEEIKPFTALFEAGSGGLSLDCTVALCPDCEGKGCAACNETGSVRHVLQSEKDIIEWFEFLAESDFNPIGIDTADAFYQLVSDIECERLGITSPVDAPHGQGWMRIFDSLRRYLGILRAAEKGIVFIMHVYRQERRLRDGSSMETAVFNVSGKSRTFLAGMANQILYFDIEPDEEGEDRYVIVAEPRSGVEAGDQWGVFPPTLDRGDSPEDAARNILDLFYE